jgi:hypothetical protein
MKRSLFFVLAMGVIAIAIWSMRRPKSAGMLADRPAKCASGQEYWALDLPAGRDVFDCREGNVWIVTTRAPASTIQLERAIKLENQHERERPVDPTREKINALSEDARNCLGMYLKYGDTKMSDLTYSQAKQIQFCDSRGLYHDLQ